MGIDPAAAGNAAEATAISQYWQAVWLADGDAAKQQAARTALTSAATWQSQVLAQAGILDHTSPDGSTLLDRLTRARWHGTAAGEDLAVAGSTSEAVAMWMQSPGHRENLLRPSFHTVGLGLARGVWSGQSALFVTADFGS